jgi:hypothetical protein
MSICQGGARVTSLWFVVPAHGRVELAAVCFRQLARTCASLEPLGIRASAVVIACDENLDAAAEVGFATVERDNRQLGRRWNDGYELAAVAGVDVVVAFGSDDWIDAAFVASGPMPEPGQIRCCRRTAVVSETGDQLARLRIPYDGGDGVRMIATETLRPLRFRPAEDDRGRAIDTSVLMNLRRHIEPELVYHDLHPLQVVDWKSASDQLNSFEACLAYADDPIDLTPYESLAPVYPAAALDEMRALHTSRMVAA